MTARACLFLVSLLLGCGGTASGVRPAWVDRANMEHPEYVYVVGRCSDKATADEARRCAIEDAREQMRNVYGVAGGLVQDEFSQNRLGMKDQGGGMHVLASLNSHWVLMAYPRRQLPPPRPR